MRAIYTIRCIYVLCFARLIRGRSTNLSVYAPPQRRHELRNAALTMTSMELLFAISLALGILQVAAAAVGFSDLQSGELETDGGVLEALGVGRVPTAVITLLLTLLFGGSGLALGPAFTQSTGPGVAGPATFATALVLALAGTVGLSRLFARLLPARESYASGKRELVGLTGRVVICLGVERAVVRVVDLGGAELRLDARVVGPPLRAADEVDVVTYDAASGRFTVTKVSQDQAGEDRS